MTRPRHLVIIYGKNRDHAGDVRYLLSVRGLCNAKIATECERGSIQEADAHVVIDWPEGVQILAAAGESQRTVDIREDHAGSLAGHFARLNEPASILYAVRMACVRKRGPKPTLWRLREIAS